MTAPQLPGADLVDKGITDLRAGVASIEAMLVSQAPEALAAVGVDLPEPLAEPEHSLSVILERSFGDGAHSKYNAYRRQLASYLRAARCAVR
jgi:hypothetical protein